MLVAASAHATEEREPQPPNVLFILADDLGWQDVGFMGSTFFETPHLDRLAENSLVLSDSYMYPSCSPSRAALATGKHSFRTQVYHVPVLERRGGPEENLFSRWTLTKDHVHYAEPLNRAGYRLIHIGKWHLVGPDPALEARKFPFDDNLSQPPNGDLSWLPAHRNPEVQAFYPQGWGYHENVGGTWWGDPARGYDEGYQSSSGGFRAPFKNPFIEDKPSDSWLTDRLTDEAIDFIRRSGNEPFFVSLHYYSPHRPSIPADVERLAMYREKPVCPVTGQHGALTDEIAAYATMVENLDQNIGRMIEFLETSGRLRETVVIFTSDNGHNRIQSFTSNLRGAKTTYYEGGMRVPTLIHQPGRVLARRDDTPIQCIDYFPTLMEIAGIDFDGGFDGVSLVPLMEGGELERDEPLFWHLASSHAVTVMRKGRYKLIQHLLQEDKVELYDLEEDLRETNDLSDRLPELRAALLEEVTRWRTAHGVPLPEASPLER
jgi:arylsulfatase A-like enzyme